MNQMKRIYNNHPLLITFCITSLILFIRIWERFFFPSLWAEDGKLFLKDAIMIGYDSLFISYGGYFHTLPRIIALITLKLFPVILYPYVFMIVCTFVYSLTISKLASEDFDNLISQKWVRFALAISLCFVPGLYEVLGNLANLHWILFFYLTVSLLSKMEKPFSNLEIVFFFFIAASTGEPIVLLPVILLKIIYFLKVKLKKQVIQHSIIFLIIISFTILNISQKIENPKEPIRVDKSEFLIGSLFTFNQYFIFQPILGDKNLVKFYDRQRTIYMYSGILIALLLFYLIKKFHIYKNNFLFPILFSVFLVPLLTWIVRPGSILAYINLYGIWDGRYSFVLAPWGLILWVKLTSSIPNEKWIFRIVGIFLFLYISLSSYRFFLKPYGKDVNWFQEYKIAEQALETGCPKNISIPMYPVITIPFNEEVIRFHFEFDLVNDKICE